MRNNHYQKKIIPQVVCFLSVSMSLCAIAVQDQAIGMGRVFNTKVEAEKAAKKIGCEGSHKMGRKWMPCSMQWYLEEQPKNK